MSGSGGGGSPSNVQQHLINMHGDWLARCVNGDATVDIERTMADLINSSFGAANPFISAYAYDSAPHFNRMENMLREFQAQVETQEMTAADLNADVNDKDIEDLKFPLDDHDLTKVIHDYGAIATETLLHQTLPRFDSEMRDVNATNGSAYVLGRALLCTANQRDINLFASDLAQKHFLSKRELQARWELTKLGARLEVRTRRYLIRYENSNWANSVRTQLLHYGLEIERMHITRASEEVTQNISFRESEFKVPFEAFQQGANLMAAISGGTAPVRTSQPSTASSVIGGALQGASAGAMLAPGAPVLGPLIGGVAGILSAVL